MTPLTHRQTEILAFCTYYATQRGEQPTMRAVAEQFRITHQSAATHLQRLRAKGYLAGRATAPHTANDSVATRLPGRVRDLLRDCEILFGQLQSSADDRWGQVQRVRVRLTDELAEPDLSANAAEWQDAPGRYVCPDCTTVVPRRPTDMAARV